MRQRWSSMDAAMRSSRIDPIRCRASAGGGGSEAIGTGERGTRVACNCVRLRSACVWLHPAIIDSRCCHVDHRMAAVCCLLSLLRRLEGRLCGRSTSLAFASVTDFAKYFSIMMRAARLISLVRTRPYTHTARQTADRRSSARQPRAPAWPASRQQQRGAGRGAAGMHPSRRL